MRGDVLEEGRQVDVPMDEGAYSFEHVPLVPEVPHIPRQEHTSRGQQIIAGRIRNKPLTGCKIDLALD